MSDQSAGYTDPLYTLAEASALTGLTVDALRQRIKRKRLESVRGNDGLVRVRLTTADLDAIRLSETRQIDQPSPSRSSDIDQTISALQGEVTSLREALTHERTRVDQERERADREAERANAATTLADQRAEALRQMGEKLARAEGVAEGLKMALEAKPTRGLGAWWRMLLGGSGG